MSWAIISLFSLGAGLFAGAIVSTRQDVMTLATASRKMLLGEHSQIPSLNMFNASDAEILATNIVLYAILAVAYIATLVFFVQARKQGAVVVTSTAD